MATDAGLHEPGTDAPPGLAGHDVSALDRGGQWAITGGKALHRRDGGAWREVTVAPDDPATALAAVPRGVVVGTAGAHLLRLDGTRLVPVPGFDAAPGRETWGTPWGGPPDVRSMTAAADGRLFVNVHVGGVVRSGDDGATWSPTIDVDADVHQVLTDPASGLVVVAAAVGFGISDDGGGGWRIDTDGLHGTYARAVAIAGDHVLLTASDGPRTKQAAVYRRRLEAREPFQRVTDGLPEWFDHNIDTHWLAAEGDDAALVTETGDVYASSDAGASWHTVAHGFPKPRAITVLSS